MNGLTLTEQELKKTVINSYPHVTFQLNQDIDAHVGLDFLEKQNGIDFSEHPLLRETLKVEGKARKKIVDDYVHRYYQDHKVELKNSLTSLQTEWEKVEPEFFDITNKLFNGYQWPSGDYKGFPSIFNCNPRWLETKSFQVYRNNVVGTSYSVAHEMLHFIFYDYLEKNDPDYIEQIGNEKLWSLSEVFDKLAFEQPEYKKFKPKVPSSYPQLQSTVTTLREKLIGKPFNIQSFLTEAKLI